MEFLEVEVGKGDKRLSYLCKMVNGRPDITGFVTKPEGKKVKLIGVGKKVQLKEEKKQNLL
jgi:hypothetical protein